MRRGTVMVLFTSIAFLVTVIYLVHAKTVIHQDSLGKDAFQILEDSRVAQKTQFYVSQSLRNAAYAGLADLSKESFFPSTVASKSCPLIQGKPLLFADNSCTYTRKDLEARYFSLTQRRFASYFASPLYGLSFQATDFPFVITYSKGFLTLAGEASHSFSYQGKKIAYTFPVVYEERIAHDFHHYDFLLKTLRDNLACIKSFAEQPSLSDEMFAQELQTKCPFSKEFSWQFQKKGDLVLITATTKDKVLFLDELSFAFAITLNNLQLPPPDNTIF